MARPTAPDHDDKAAAVLAAAGQVFAQRGYEGATMLDVAQAAGFSKAGVYHYLASKEHLLHGLVRRSLQQAVEALASRDPPRPPSGWPRWSTPMSGLAPPGSGS